MKYLRPPIEISKSEKICVCGFPESHHCPWTGECQGFTDSGKTLDIVEFRYHPKFIIPKDLKKRMLERDGYACVECYSSKNLTADHIFPESLGGETVLDNLQTLCKKCNSKKGVKIVR